MAMCPCSLVIAFIVVLFQKYSADDVVDWDYFKVEQYFSYFLALRNCILNAGTNLRLLRLLFSLKPKEMAKMRLLAIWIDQK